MSTQTNNSKKQVLKKYIIFLLMFLVFGVSIWFIYSPSEIDKLKEKAKSGYNDMLPDPANGDIVEDKIDAYEQDRMKKQQNEKMKSLQDYSTFMDEFTKGNETTSEVNPNDDVFDDTPDSNQEPSAIQSSVSSYKDINKTLGSFYEEPEEDLEKEEFKKRLEELEGKISKEGNTQDLMDEQMTLMEKSYQMAAKYLPQGNGSIQQVGLSDNEDKLKDLDISPVKQFQSQIVSALYQPLNNEEFMDQYGTERNMDFNTVGSAEQIHEKNTIDAVTDCEQTIVNGQAVRLRLQESVMAGTRLIPINTIITGTAKIQGERLYIDISVIEHEGAIIPVDMTVLDLDGQSGIYIPGSMEIQAVKEIISNAGSSVGSSFTLTQKAGEQIISDLTKGLLQGTSQYMRKKINQIKVTVKPGYKLLLLPNNKK